MKRYKTALFLVLFLLSFNSFSQQTTKRQVVYAELLGSGVIGSVNYDFRLKPGNDGSGMRVGFGYVPDVFVFPIGLNVVIGENRVAFEYGVGVSIAAFLKTKSGNQTFSTGINNLGYMGFLKAGIRFTPKNNGMFYNFNWNPIINNVETRWVWFGLGIGYSWNK